MLIQRQCQYCGNKTGSLPAPFTADARGRVFYPLSHTRPVLPMSTRLAFFCSSGGLFSYYLQ